MQLLHCGRCHTRVALEALQCPRCCAELGYHAASGRMQVLAASGQPACANREQAGVCNWLRDSAGSPLCASCRLTTLIPDLGVPGNLARWAALEQAKRRLLCTLLRLGLEPGPQPLRFRFVQAGPHEEVRTAHSDGTVTINIAEADDTHRLQQRLQHAEPQRTLLGHLRHEVAHHLQQAWVAGDAQGLAQCRECFGDERQDYAQALARHHQQGPPLHWADRHISAYASAHPWEDWAETCAHLLLVNEALHTTQAWQAHSPLREPPGSRSHPGSLLDPAADRLLHTQWLPLAAYLNEMSAALGTEPAYPFVVAPLVAQKMRTVQALLARGVERRAGRFNPRTCP